MKNFQIRNKQNEIIGLKIFKFEVIAKYFVGYGANLKKIRGVKNRKFEILASSKEMAIHLIEKKSKLHQGLSAGWIFSAKKLAN